MSYSNTNLFATDGVLYKEEYVSTTRFKYASRTDIEGVIYNTLYDILDKNDLKNYYYICSIKSITMIVESFRNLNGTDRKVIKFALFPLFVNGKFVWLKRVVIHQDYIDGEWVDL